ncbi:type 1 glutamine amidotransferase domain-containing protein [Corynebacterium hadale]|uniref:type 1 glutamine amidotransferase domain-containing protein n=1 Tax=Corynebacterium hadale TaxID=2026255 RepID=UPI001EF2813E|nr:type 1 glutamine amidotransferase domain-containing protein [Corynebacterium hadale]MCG7255373.1 type 1 glutamine amidotransferase domain-containing protein [Corynebacterium hadale]MCG7257677.1 type 1 glutamine amidotransferase domain-containing protein [Corynebacterium hadale]MCG7266372.1 type 1 glutamine amidotransferase domain-containing protein [Corynebacterium hadale]
MTKVLMIVSAAEHWTLNDGTLHPTGFWAEELVTPYAIFTDAGWDVDVATPGGVAPTVDKVSLDDSAGDAETLAAVKTKLEALEPVLAKPLDLDDITAESYDLVFYPGGHGPMENLAVNETSARILSERMADNTPLALLCHAPAAVLATENAQGGSPFSGRTMTGFSNDEERAAGLADKAPWLLEDRLVALGAEYTKAPEAGAPYVTVDGNLYTGQNPSSSHELAQRLVKDLA